MTLIRERKTAKGKICSFIAENGNIVSAYYKDGQKKAQRITESKGARRK